MLYPYSYQKIYSQNIDNGNKIKSLIRKPFEKYPKHSLKQHRPDYGLMPEIFHMI